MKDVNKRLEELYKAIDEARMRVKDLHSDMAQPGKPKGNIPKHEKKLYDQIKKDPTYHHNYAEEPKVDIDNITKSEEDEKKIKEVIEKETPKPAKSDDQKIKEAIKEGKKEEIKSDPFKENIKVVEQERQKKQRLIKALEDAGMYPSAILLKNWDEKDLNAEMMEKALKLKSNVDRKPFPGEDRVEPVDALKPKEDAAKVRERIANTRPADKLMPHYSDSDALANHKKLLRYFQNKGHDVNGHFDFDEKTGNTTPKTKHGERLIERMRNTAALNRHHRGEELSPADQARVDSLKDSVKMPGAEMPHTGAKVDYSKPKEQPKVTPPAAGTTTDVKSK